MNRRIGGLEIDNHFSDLGIDMNRRIGGLEIKGF